MRSRSVAEVRGSVPWTSAAPSVRYQPGRICAEEGCGTRISIYNRSERCWRHGKVTASEGGRIRTAA